MTSPGAARLSSAPVPADAEGRSETTAVDGGTNGPSGSSDSPTRSRRLEYLAVGVLTLAVFAFYLVYSLSRYRIYLSAGYDLGIFDQAVRAYSHFQAPIVPLKGADYNVLGDHFHPIIAVIAPLYWIWDNPCVLLIVQSALIASSVPVVYRFTRRRAGAEISWLITASYALGWALQGMADFDFHEVAFGVPLIALAIDALDRRADRQLLICAGLLLLVREDMGLVLVALGIIRLTIGWPERRRQLGWRSGPGRQNWPGAALIIAGFAGYVLATAVVIPHFARDGHFDYWSYQALGPNLPSALFDIVVHPIHAVRVFFSPWIKTQTLLYFFVPLLFLPLRSRYALIAVPLLAQRFFNSREQLWSTHYHYNAMPWVVLTLAMIDGAARLGVFRWRPTRYGLAGWVVVVPIWMTLYGTVQPDVITPLINGSAFRMRPEAVASAELVAMVPADVCVAVDDRLAPHLTARDYVTLASAQYGTADYVALDFAYTDVGNFGPSPAAVYGTFAGDGYQTVYARDGLVLMRSPNYHGPSSACRPLGPGKR